MARSYRIERMARLYRIYQLFNSTNKNAPHEAGHFMLQMTLNYTANIGIVAFAAASL